MKPRKHGRGTGGAALVSDAAGRGDAQGTPLPARLAASGHVDPTWFSPTRADASRHGFDACRRQPNRANSGLNRPYRPESAVLAETADSGRNSKKKKKNPERTVLLNTNPTSAQFHSKRQNTLLTFRLTHFVSVLSASLRLFHLPCYINTFFLQLSLMHS